MTSPAVNAAASPSPSPDQNLPRPLEVGDFVSCTLRPNSSDEPLIAKVVALDEDYGKAAREYHKKKSSKRSKSKSSNRDASGSTVDLTKSDTAPTDSDQSPPSSTRDHPLTFASEIRETMSAPNNSSAQPASAPDFEGPTKPLEDTTEQGGEPTVPRNPIAIGKVYVSFPGRDHRLDRWEFASRVERASPPSPTPEKYEQNSATIRTRAMKRARDEVIPSADADIALDRRTATAHGTPHEQVPIVRNINELVLGDYSIDAWYYSPMPKAYGKIDTLYVCGVCLQHEGTVESYLNHKKNCKCVNPPGRLVYNDDVKEIRVYEVDGYYSDQYCTRLSRVAKLFLEHKSLCYDVCAFLFYVVTLCGEIAGFFSKEKPLTLAPYNVACILTFPQHQRKGIGSFLIDFSYELTRREGKVGTPERPLSDLGQLSYRRHWTYSIIKHLRSCQSKSGTLLVSDISAVTGICEEDIVPILKCLNLLHIWKGVSSARISKMDLEAAAAKCSPPRITVEAQYILSHWANVPGKDGGALPTFLCASTPANASKNSPGISRASNGVRALSAGVTKTSLPIKSKKGKKKNEKIAFENGVPIKVPRRKSVPRVYSEAMTTTSHATKLKSSSHISNGKCLPQTVDGVGSDVAGTSSGFKSDQLELMDEIIHEYKPEVVNGQDASISIPPHIIRSLAERIGQPTSKVRKKVRQLAKAICDERGMNVPRESGAKKERVEERRDTPATEAKKELSYTPAVVAAPAPTSSRADDEYEEDWYGPSRESGLMVDVEQEIDFGDDEQLDDYGLAGRDMMSYGSGYLGESSEEVPKREEMTSRVEFVEATEDVVVID